MAVDDGYFTLDFFNLHVHSLGNTHILCILIPDRLPKLTMAEETMVAAPGPLARQAPSAEMQSPRDDLDPKSSTAGPEATLLPFPGESAV